MKRITFTEQFKTLFIRNVPFIDVRAEGEFLKGHFPTSYNFPILNDNERKVVGTCYKEKGRDAAVKLGHSLVNGKIKDRRVQAWCAFASTNQNAHVYCWRGGMRSRYAWQWMKDSGVEISVVHGGFKALRKVLSETINEIATNVPMIRIGGKTGTSKTVLIKTVECSTDLEGHANHRGSSFGRQISGAATQVNFENNLGIDLLKKQNRFPLQKLIVEDESRRIGSCEIPKLFFNAMRSSPVGLIEMPLDFRINHIKENYIVGMCEKFYDTYPEDAWKQFVNYLNNSLSRIKKRLGLAHFTKVYRLMNSAIEKHNLFNDTSGHDEWISALLLNYYDPMYEYQLSRQSDQIAFRGCYKDVLAWATSQSTKINGTSIKDTKLIY